jgi:acyl carrier protein
MEFLLQELREKIVDTLDLVDVDPADIDPDEPLVKEGLGLDSIDILELAVMLERTYGVKIDSKEIGKKAFASLRALAQHIAEHRQQV